MIGVDRQFRIVTYNSADDKYPNPQSLLLAELYTLLEHEETDCVLADGTPGCRGKKCPKKDGLAWSPGFIPSGKTRLKENVESLDLAVFDIDHITEPQLAVMHDGLLESGHEFYLHSTHNHLPPDDQSFRLVIPFTRAITPAEWKQIWFAITRKFNLPADKATRDPCRLSFFPRALRGRPFVNVHQEGTLIDPKDLLLENAKFSREQATAPKQREQIEPGAVNLDELKSRLRKYDPQEDPDGEKKEIVRRILDEEPLAMKGSRGYTTLRAGAIVGALVPLGTPFEAAFELLRPAVSKIQLLPGDKDDSNVEAWTNQVRRGFEQSQENKEQEAIERDDVAGKLTALAKRKREALHPKPPPLSLYGYTPPPLAPPPAFVLGPPPAVPALVLGPPPASRSLFGVSLPPPPPPPPPPAGPHFPIPPEGESDTDSDGDWRIEKMINTVDKQGLTHPKNTFSNVTTVLENHRAWKGVLKYNELTNEPEAHGGPIPVKRREPERLIQATRIWMAQQEELDLPQFEISGAVEFVAREHHYDPVRAYLTGLKHDGTKRIGTWLVDYCGARLVDDTKFGEMHFDLLEVRRIWVAVT